MSDYFSRWGQFISMKCRSGGTSYIGPIGPIGPPGRREAGERAGLVDFNNYRTFNRLQEPLGSTFYTKPQQDKSLKTEITNYNSSNRLH